MIKIGNNEIYFSFEKREKEKREKRKREKRSRKKNIPDSKQNRLT